MYYNVHIKFICSSVSGANSNTVVNRSIKKCLHHHQIKTKQNKNHFAPLSQSQCPSQSHSPGELRGVDLPVAAALVLPQPIAVLVVVQRLDAVQSLAGAEHLQYSA